MRFFVPSASESRESEQAYEKVRAHVATFIGPITAKRIYRIKYDDNGRAQSAQIGSDRHSFGTGPVVAIFEAQDGDYYVCTQKNSSGDAEPHPIHGSAVIEAEEFSALA